MEILKKYSVLVLLVLGIASCGEKEKPVALSPELTAKKLSMTVSKVLDKDVSVYLISEEAVEGEPQKVRVLTPELVEANYAYELAKLNLQQYRQATLPQQRRHLDEQIRLADHEIYLLRRRLND